MGINHVATGARRYIQRNHTWNFLDGFRAVALTSIGFPQEVPLGFG
jgi:hypothetical protein